MLFKDNQAKELVKGIHELKDNQFVHVWLKEHSVYSVVTYDENKHPICIALLHKIEFDPLHIFDKPPLLLDYIYTMEKYRRKNYAYKLIVKMTKNNKIIGYCCNDESVQLFVKCGFSYHMDQFEMVRFPPFSK
jgi:hypothetical protein